MKTFEELYDMYCEGDENIYEHLYDVDFDELYEEADKQLAKYYEFKTWLETQEQFYD